MESGLLHSHPAMELELGVDNNHVIVDRADWRKVRIALEKLGFAELGLACINARKAGEKLAKVLNELKERSNEKN